MKAERRARKHTRGGVAAAVAVAVAAAAVPHALSARAGAPPAEPPPTGLFELPATTIDSLRSASAGLAALEDALATGRSELGLCVDRTGHYVANPGKLVDGLLDPLDPEALVYADITGTRQLVAVAWMLTAPGQVQGVPLHLDEGLDAWVLHAWVGLDNPAGILADRNPLVGACDPAAPAQGAPPAEPGAATEPLGASGLRSGPPAAPVAEPPTGLFELPPDVIDELRTTFAGFDDPAVAVAAGWPASGRCAERAGWAFVDRTTIFDGELDPAQPELLVYGNVDGATRLAAVGWASSAPAQVLGVPLHRSGDIWVLHAWVGVDNPAGMLADLHPGLAPCADGLPGVDPLPAPTGSVGDDLASTAGTAATTTGPTPTSTANPTSTTTSTGATTTAPATTEPATTAPPSGFPFTVSATTVNFGTVLVGSTSGTFINVTNTGPVARQIAIAHEPTGPLFPVSSNCSGTIDPGVSCRVSYSFAPTRTMLPFSTQTSLRLACCGGMTEDVTITLRGEAVEPTATPSGPVGPTTPPVVDPGQGSVTSTGG